MRAALYAVIVIAVAGGLWAVYEGVQASPEQQRLARLRQLQVPPPGAARFAFLSEQVPDVVGQVTCSCCANKLIQCYEGACPVTCGPCNEMGKKAYDMYAHGQSIEAIQAYMAEHHPVSPGASMMGM